MTAAGKQAGLPAGRRFLPEEELGHSQMHRSRRRHSILSQPAGCAVGISTSGLRSSCWRCVVPMPLCAALLSPQVRLPRTFRRFCGLMVQLLQKLSIRATNGPDKLLKVVKGPVTKYFPPGESAARGRGGNRRCLQRRTTHAPRHAAALIHAWPARLSLSLLSCTATPLSPAGLACHTAILPAGAPLPPLARLSPPEPPPPHGFAAGTQRTRFPLPALCASLVCPSCFVPLQTRSASASRTLQRRWCPCMSGCSGRSWGSARSSSWWAPLRTARSTTATWTSTSPSRRCGRRQGQERTVSPAVPRFPSERCRGRQPAVQAPAQLSEFLAGLGMPRQGRLTAWSCPCGAPKAPQRHHRGVSANAFPHAFGGVGVLPARPSTCRLPSRVAGQRRPCRLRAVCMPSPTFAACLPLLHRSSRCRRRTHCVASRLRWSRSMG